jgi:hypothetical protein
VAEGYVINIKESIYEVTVPLHMEDYITERLHTLGDIVAVSVLKKTVKETPCINRFYD